MPGLTDVLGTPETVTVNGKSLAVHGLSFAAIAALVKRFPAFKTMLQNAQQGTEVKAEISVEDILEQGPSAVSAVIAAMCNGGDPGGEEDEKAAARIPLGSQVRILAKGKVLTIPDGISPFVDDLVTIGIIERLPASKGSGSAGPASTQPTPSTELPPSTESAPTK